jgi:hypothetical protein
VEVIAPAGAPHLRQIADELAGRVLRQIETLPPEGLHYLLRVGAEIARARDEYERFRRRLGVK